MKFGRLIVIAVVVYVAWKYVWPAIQGGHSGKQGGKQPAGRQMG